MGLLNWKNSNESAYVGGKKHWVDVIKNSGDGNLLIWKQPEEDFNTNSTLIVMPGEQAIFINQGNIEQVFTSGTYKLSTENYPFISRLRNVFSGGISTFNCVVYFVREADSMEIEWGTMQPIRYGDPMLGPVNIKAGGAYKIQIANPQKFLTKLIGNNIDFETQLGLNQYFANEFSMHIADAINRTLQELQSQNYKEVFHYVGNLVNFSKSVEPQIQSIIDDYGLRIKAFSISRCKDEYEDPEVEKMITDKKRMQYLGGGWAAQQQVDIMKNISTNEGSGGIAAAGAGLGMGFNMGSIFGNMTQQSMGQNPMQNQTSPAENPIMGKLKQLKELLDMGLISQADFDQKKDEILKQL
jgi:membrane protease subunit (stomatin/prohibitin family)